MLSWASFRLDQWHLWFAWRDRTRFIEASRNAGERRRAVRSGAAEAGDFGIISLAKHVAFCQMPRAWLFFMMILTNHASREDVPSRQGSFGRR